MPTLVLLPNKLELSISLHAGTLQDLYVEAQKAAQFAPFLQQEVIFCDTQDKFKLHTYQFHYYSYFFLGETIHVQCLALVPKNSVQIKLDDNTVVSKIFDPQHDTLFDLYCWLQTQTEFAPWQHANVEFSNGTCSIGRAEWSQFNALHLGTSIKVVPFTNTLATVPDSTNFATSINVAALLKNGLFIDENSNTDTMVLKCDKYTLFINRTAELGDTVQVTDTRLDAPYLYNTKTKELTEQSKTLLHTSENMLTNIGASISKHVHVASNYQQQQQFTEVALQASSLLLVLGDLFH